MIFGFFTYQNPMAENFVAVCDILLKFHNLSVKFVYKFNEKIIHQTRNFLSFYLNHNKHDALSLTLIIIFDVTNLFIISLLVEFLKWKDKQNHT